MIKFEERFLKGISNRYILIVLVDIVGVLFFELVSLFKKLDSKLESFFIE